MGSLALLFLREAATPDRGHLERSHTAYRLGPVINDGPGTPWSVSRADALGAAWLLLTHGHISGDDWVVPLVVTMLTRAATTKLFDGAEAELVTAFAGQLSARRHLRGGTADTLRPLLLATLAAPPRQSPYPGLLDGTDPWSTAVVATLPPVAEPAVVALLEQLTRAAGSKPSTRWLAATEQALHPAAARAGLRAMVECLVTVQPITVASSWENTSQIVRRDHLDLVRAALWATIAVEEPWVEPTLLVMLCRERRQL